MRELTSFVGIVNEDVLLCFVHTGRGAACSTDDHGPLDFCSAKNDKPRKAILENTATLQLHDATILGHEQ